MHAIQITEFGGPDVMELVELHRLVPAEDDVVVEVAAAGVNFVDTYVRSGGRGGDLPRLLGAEGAGTVVDVGPNVQTLAVGDRVAWARAAGSYATHVALPAADAVRVPDGLDLELAAAVALQGGTAHYLSHSSYPLEDDDVGLVWAAAGGVGRLLVQMAKRRGARVIACTSTDEKADEVRRIGADEVINYRTDDVVARVKELTDGQGVDVVYDSVARATFEISLDCARRRGMIVLYGQASGPVPPFDLNVLAAHGSLTLCRPSLGDYTATPSELEWRLHAVFDQVAAGQLDVVIHDRYPLAEAARAHRDIESGTTVGKLLLIP
ncbi:MAG: quinone oxidoreductase [Nitriliruptoraceae bacterium]